jgi:hypothetical protein
MDGARSAILRHSLWLAPVALALVFYAPILSGGWTFPHGDFTHHFFAFALHQAEALRAGTLPIWNAHTFSGHPFLADVQAAVYYPVSNALLALTIPVTDPAWRFYLLQVEAVVHTALGGVFMALLLRDLSGSRVGALLGATVFAFSGYLTGYPPLQLAVLRSAIWLPLTFWCLLRAWQAPRAVGWWVGAGAAIAAAFLAGHTQTYLLQVYAVAGWVLLLAVGRGRKGLGGIASAMVGLVAALATAAGLTAAQWLPSVEFWRLSVRASMDLAEAGTGFPLRDTWQILLPGVLTHYSPLYIGVVGVVCAIGAGIWAAFAKSTRLDHRGAGWAATPIVPWRVGVAYFGLLALLALLASYGANGFLYPLLYRLAPGWDLFRGQERAAYLATFGLAALAGYGAAVAPGVPPIWRRRAAVVTGTLVVGGVYAFGMLLQLPGRTAIGPTEYLVIAASTMVLGLAAALLLWLPGWSRRRGALLVALAAVNLLWANMGVNFDRSTPGQKVQLAPELVGLADAVAAGAGAQGLPGRVYNEYRVDGDYGMRLGVEDVWGSSPLRVARYARLFDEFPLDRMWLLLGVEHVLTWRRELFGPSTLLGEYPQASDTTYLHRLPGMPVRGRLVHDLVEADDETAVRLLADHQFDITKQAIVGPEVRVASGSGARGTARIVLRRLAANRLGVDLASEHGGLLVLSEVWMPGWEVKALRCDDTVPECMPGKQAGDLFKPVRADLTLVGIPVPAGAVAFELTYAPRSVVWGFWISALALAAVAGVPFVVMLAGLRKRRV